MPSLPGATAVPLQADLADAEQLDDAVAHAIRQMGGLDVLINNASALCTQRAPSAKRMDLVHHVNSSATLRAIQGCHAALTESRGAIVTLAPPVRLARLEWIARHPAYTLSKYAMSMATLGAATEAVRANNVWPRRLYATAAVRMLEQTGQLPPGAHEHARPPHEFADAVHRVATGKWNAECLLDEDVVVLPASEAPLDLFVEEDVRGVSSLS